MAVGDSLTKLVEPLRVLSSSKFKVQSLKLIKEEEVEEIVIGLSEGKLSGEIKRFGKKLQEETQLPVEFFDETLTTQDAQDILTKSGRSRKSRRQKEDAIAAAIMLEYYIEARLC